MKPQYKYISFKIVEGRPKWWRCTNNRNGDELGIVRWYGPWRQYCYFATAQAVYSKDCLIDIENFIRACEEGSYET